VALSSKRKQKSTADVLGMHIKKRKEEKGGNDVLKAQKAVAYQLKSYCMRMNQLIDLSKMKDSTASLEQSELMERMKGTIEVAV
jgi:hypothetical protein